MLDEVISREAAIDALADYIHNVDKVMGTGHLNADDCKDAAASVFEELPSAQPERKKGKWIELEPKGVWTSVYHCSECGGAVMSCKVDLPKYCGHCGARMEEESDGGNS